MKWSNLRLKRGVTYSDDLYHWHQDFAEGRFGKRRDGIIALQNEVVTKPLTTTETVTETDAATTVTFSVGLACTTAGFMFLSMLSDSVVWYYSKDLKMYNDDDEFSVYFEWKTNTDAKSSGIYYR